MQIPLRQTQWHGIDLLQFPAAKEAQHKAAGPEFYRQFYEELEKHPVNPAWIAGKASFGPVCIQRFFQPWEQQHGRKPKILSLGIGKGYIEEMWLREGYDVTLQECQEFSMRELLKKYPNARSAVGDATKMQFQEKYDVIAIMTLDSTLNRADLQALLRHASQWLTPTGFILFHSATVLSLRQTLAESIKYVRQKLSPRPSVFWGWWRTVGDLCGLGERSGLRVLDVFRFGGREGAISRRMGLRQRLPTFKSPLIVILFGPP